MLRIANKVLTPIASLIDQFLTLEKMVKNGDSGEIYSLCTSSLSQVVRNSSKWDLSFTEIS